MFPSVPVLNGVAGTIPQQYMFNWTWSGDADGMYISGGISEVVEYLDDSFEGSLNLETTFSYDLDFAPYCGHGNFDVGYGYVFDGFSENCPIGYMELTSGDNIFDPASDELLGYIASEGTVGYTVVPEPTSMVLMTLGGLALIGRKRK